MRRDFRKDYENLMSGFDRFLTMAEALPSPNAEDDIYTRAAIVGFSFHSRTEEWGRNHFELVQKRRANDYSDQNLAWYGTAASRHALFACLSLGFLLGLFQAEKISEEEFDRGEAEIPAFLALHSTQLAASPIAGV